MDTWRNKPQSIEEINLDGNSITHVAFLDENGNSNMKDIIKCINNNKKIEDGSKFFSVTSVLYKLNDLHLVKENFNNIKCEFWPSNGLFNYGNGNSMKVCFHSKEIRDRKGPFSDNCIDYDFFIERLTELMMSLPIVINTSFINKEDHFRKYGQLAQSPYEISLTFILERILNNFIKDSDELIIILESRGKKEDLILLQHLVSLLNRGTYYLSSSQFKKIKGIFFNNKRVKNNDMSYYGLESADLCAHPIYRYCITNNKNKAFISIEPKVHGYPSYLGRGLKMFP